MCDVDGKPHQSALRMARSSAPGHAYFITKRVNKLVGPVFASAEHAEVLAKSILWARDQGWWRLLGFVIMPDHYHLTAGLGDRKSLSDAIKGVDQFVSTQINRRLSRNGSLWQTAYYEHLIRDRADFDTILAYMHENPVRAGLADAVDGYPFSTANPKYSSEIDWQWLGPSLPALVDTEYRFTPQSVPQQFR